MKKPLLREFDTYAQEYQDLLNDPIRERFAKNQIFFHRRKLEVLLELLKEAGVDPASQSWLDVKEQYGHGLIRRDTRRSPTGVQMSSWIEFLWHPIYERAKVTEMPGPAKKKG